MNVLVIAPHIDDEILGVGGTMIKHVDAGDTVCVVFVADREGMVTKQREESIRVSQLVGYSHTFWLGLNDELLDSNSRHIIKALEKVYREVQPDVVYTCHRGDVNTDHQAVFNASAVVCRPLQAHPPSKFLSYEVPSSTSQGIEFPFTPNVYNQLTTNQLEQKIKAFEIYEDEIRDMPNPRNSDGICNYACQRGMECGKEFAEAFMLLRGIYGNAVG